MHSVRNHDFEALVATIKGHDLDPAVVTINQVRRWHQTAEDQRHLSFARGYITGRALAVRKTAVEHGGKEAFAAAVGITPQMVNIYVRGYAAIERTRKTETGFSIPDGCSFTGWVKAGCPGGGGSSPGGGAVKKNPTAAQQAASAKRSAKVALAKVLRLPVAERCALLEDIAAEVEAALAENQTAAQGEEAVVEGETGAEVAFAGDGIPDEVEDASADGADDSITLVANPDRKVRKPKLGRVPGLFPYLGGKSQSVAWLVERIGKLPPGTVLVEPCCGSAALSLNMLARGLVEQVRLNDTSPGVAAYINAILHDHEVLKERVLSWEPTVRSLKKLWHGAKDGTLSGVDLAFAHVVVQCICQGGLGVMTHSAPSKLPNWKDWNPYREAAKIDLHHRLLAERVVGDCCTSMDMLEVIAEPGNRFLFIDPPYVATGKTSYQSFLNEAGHRTLAEALDQTPHRWLLAYDDHPLVHDLYAAFEVEIVDVKHYSRAGVNGVNCERPEVRICSWSRMASALEEAA